jgi:hypothetical protein
MPVGVFIVNYGGSWAVCYNNLTELSFYNHVVNRFVGKRHSCTLFSKDMAVEIATKYKHIN